MAVEFDGSGFWVCGAGEAVLRTTEVGNAVPEAMRNEALDTLDVLVGEWTVTMSDAWFLEPPGTEVQGSATVEWFGEAFLLVRATLQGEMSLAIGRSDANDTYAVLYHDDRGVCRVFAMTWDGGHWTMSREDPDFHQRFVADVEPERISGRWEASEDQGRTWRKDFDLVFDRVVRRERAPSPRT